MKTLYVSDLDETLLNTKGELSEYSVNTINKLIEKGEVFAYATARSLLRASSKTNKLNISNPVILHNGVFIMNTNTKEIVSSCVFSEEEIKTLKNLFNDSNIKPFIYSLINGEEKISYVHNSPVNEYVNNYLETRKGDIRLNPITEIEKLYLGVPYYCLSIGTESELTVIYDKIKNDNRFNCIVQKEPRKEEYYCEIMPKLATKANAILTLKDILNCNKIVSFGDGLNDIPMFEISDECYAVENAVGELKNIATNIIDSNDNDGVAKWLNKNVLNKKE